MGGNESTGRRGRWVLGEDGKWREGAAKPELLREDLRKLPGHWVTKDDQDGDKIHELDAPHVVASLQDDLEKADTTAPEKKEELPPLEKRPFSQELIDLVRCRVLQACIRSAAADSAMGKPVSFAVQHVWFPEPHVRAYELRTGNPPSDSERPKHLKGLDLVIDMLNWPQRIRDLAAQYGIAVPDWNKLKQEADVKKREGELYKHSEELAESRYANGLH